MGVYRCLHTTIVSHCATPFFSRTVSAAAMWSEHQSACGRTYYYNRSTRTSTWTAPPAAELPKALPPSLDPALQPSICRCLADPDVAALVSAIVSKCGLDALPSVRAKAQDDAFCAGGRGGAFCCASSRIYLCRHVRNSR